MTRRRAAWALTGVVGGALGGALGGCAGQPSPAPDTPVDTPVRGPETDAVLGEEPWSFGPSKGVVVRTTHYRLFTTMDDPALRARVPRFMEEALAHYRTALGDLPAPTVRLDSYLMANRTQWAAVAQRIMGEQASAVLGITRGGFAARGVGVYFDIGLYDTLAVAAHEGWHQYTQRVFREPLPVWLEEGIASYMEGHQWVDGAARFAPWANLERFDQLRKAASLGKLVSLGDLLEATPQALLSGADDRALTYYAQVWALTHFLHDGEDGRYRTSLRRVVREASSGMLSRTLQSELGHRAAAGAMARRNGPGVALAYFSADLSRLESEYRAFVEAIVATGGRGRAVSGSAGAAR